MKKLLIGLVILTAIVLGGSKLYASYDVKNPQDTGVYFTTTIDHTLRDGYGGAIRIDQYGRMLVSPSSSLVVSSAGTASNPIANGYFLNLNSTTSTITAIASSTALSLGDGTAANPSLYFTADPDTGLYRSSTNTLGITANGTEQILIGDGTVAYNNGMSSITFEATNPIYNMEQNFIIDLDKDSNKASRYFTVRDRGAEVFSIRQGGRTIHSVTGNILSLEAGDTIAPANFRRFVRVAGDGGAVTLTSTPNITAGNNGEIMSIIGTSDPNSVTLQDESVLTGSLLRLNGGINVTLGARDTIEFVYLTGENAWIELSRSNN